MSRPGPRLPDAFRGNPRGFRQDERWLGVSRCVCVKTVIQYLLVAAVGGVVLSGTPVRAEIVVKDPDLKAALKDYERFSAGPFATRAKTDSGRPVKMPALLGSLFQGVGRNAAPRMRSP
jgi:hypothetical protein